MEPNTKSSFKTTKMGFGQKLVGAIKGFGRKIAHSALYKLGEKGVHSLDKLGHAAVDVLNSKVGTFAKAIPVVGQVLAGGQLAIEQGLEVLDVVQEGDKTFKKAVKAQGQSARFGLSKSQLKLLPKEQQKKIRELLG